MHGGKGTARCAAELISGSLICAALTVNESGLFQAKGAVLRGNRGPDRVVLCETDHAMFAMTRGWRIVNHEYFPWSEDAIMQDDKIGRMKVIGRNLVEAARDIAAAYQRLRLRKCGQNINNETPNEGWQDTKIYRRYLWTIRN